jgi:hypothetical protein
VDSFLEGVHGEGGEFLLRHVGSRFVFSVGLPKIEMRASPLRAVLVLHQRQWRCIPTINSGWPSIKPMLSIFARANSRGFIDERASVVWEKPAIPETGAVEVVSLIIPAKYLSKDLQEGGPGKRLFEFGIQDHEHAARVVFFMSKEPMKTLEAKLLKIGMPLFCFPLDNGTSVHMIIQESHFTRPQMTSQQGNPRMDFPNDMSDVVTARGLIYSHPLDGSALYIWEMGGVTIDTQGSEDRNKSVAV